MHGVKPRLDAFQMTGYGPRRIAGVQDVQFGGPSYFIGALPSRPLADSHGCFQFAVKFGKDAAATSHLFRSFILIRTTWKKGEQSEYPTRLNDCFVKRSRNRPASAVETIENFDFVQN